MRPVAAADRPKADAIVTRTPGLVIGVLTADCTPVLFADPEARVVGAAHAGWRGAVGGVLEATIAAMEQLGAERSRIIARRSARPLTKPHTKWVQNSKTRSSKVVRATRASFTVRT